MTRVTDQLVVAEVWTLDDKSRNEPGVLIHLLSQGPTREERVYTLDDGQEVPWSKPSRLVS